ncbi:MAG: calcium-binding protein [Nostocaceae cyanobacterium]|nr:calcium-binding protein [Nostocaceae cyanobacterium]
MTSDTLFLQPVAPINPPILNSAEATGGAQFFYNQEPSLVLAAAEAETLVKGGVNEAIADATATFFRDDPSFATLFTSATSDGLDGAFQGKAKSEAKIMAGFSIGAGETLSFDFVANLNLSATEIENPDAYYNKAKGKTTFVLLDISKKRPQVIDYFGYKGKLISSQQTGELKLGSSHNVTVNSPNETYDIDGNNGTDSLTGEVTGNYERTFKHDTEIVIVEINESVVKFAGDNLIGNLGDDVIYGTIFNDKFKGSKNDDKIYASLGNDRVDGGKGDDIIEGSIGKDRLRGQRGDDKLNGGFDNDDLIGGKGSDIMVGGEGYDVFIFDRNHIGKGDSDIIEDFQVGIDQLKFKGWGDINAEQLFSGMTSQIQIDNTLDGTVFSFNSGGELLLRNVGLDSLSASDFIFA